MRTSAVIKAAGIAPFIIAAMTRRTAIASITDSNGDQVSVTGHNQGMRRAASYMLGCWGSGVFPGRGQAGYESGLLEATGSGITGLTGAPAGFSDLCFNGATGGPETGDWFAAGWPGNSASGAMGVFSSHPMDTHRALKCHTRLWRPADGFAVSLNPNLWSGAGVGSVVYPGINLPAPLPEVPADGITDFEFDVPAGALVNFADPNNPAGNGASIGYREQRFGAADITGAFGILYRQIEDAQMFRGIAWSRFVGIGGQSARMPATNLCNVYGDKAICEWFRTHAVTQVDSGRRRIPPMMLIQIIEGGNDAQDTTSSVVYRRGGGFGSATTTGNALSNTKQGFKNNIQAIINRLRDVWVNQCGYSEDNLFFLLGPYHPQPPTTPQYSFTRTTVVDAYVELCNENANCTAMDGYRLDTHETFSAPLLYEPLSGNRNTPVTDTYYRAPTGDPVDVAHLNENGYRNFGLNAWRTLMDAIWDLSIATPALQVNIKARESGVTLLDRR